jgi:peptide/nickel transport system substrate-binding protein
VQALIRGEVDIVDQPSLDLIPVLRGNPAVIVKVIDRLGNQLILRPNHLVPPFNNPKARQALLLAASDQGAYLSTVESDPELRRSCWAVFMCGTPLETTAGQGWLMHSRSEAIAKARSLLAGAGYKGEPVVIMSPSDRPVFKALGVVTEQLLAQAGFNVDQQVMDWGTLVQRRVSRESPQTSRSGWNLFPAWGTGPVMSSPFMNTTAPTPCDGHNYFGWPCDEALERIRREFLAASTLPQIRDVNDRFNSRFYEVVPYVPLGQILQPVAFRRELNGVPQDIRLSLWNIEKP